MKKMLCVLLSVLFAMSVLTGCSNTDIASQTGRETSPPATSNNSEPKNDSEQSVGAPTHEAESEGDPNKLDSASPENPTSTDSKVLIVYYSLSGTTENIAKQIESKTGGDLYLLQPKTPYPNDQEAVGNEMTAERENNAIRDLQGDLPDLSNYDYILVGGPVWSGEPSNPVQKYLSMMDFGGKKVAGFWSAFGDPANYADVFKSLVKNGDILDGLSLINADISDSARLDAKIDTWVKALGIPEAA